MARIYDLERERMRRKPGPQYDSPRRQRARFNRDLAITLRNLGQTYAQIAEHLGYANASVAYKLIHCTRLDGDDAAS